MNIFDQLQNGFSKGKTPKNLEGFYKGTLALVIPKYPIEYFGNFFSKFWLPWHGKTFTKNKGINNVSFGITAFSFSTKITKGIEDNINLLQLNYDVPENPSMIRKIIDELVEVEKNNYLGKAYLKEKDSYRLVAFFRLMK